MAENSFSLRLEYLHVELADLLNVDSTSQLQSQTAKPTQDQ